MINIAIIGNTYSDFCLYLAKMFNALQYKTVILDNAKSKHLASCIPAEILGIRRVDFRNVSYMQDIKKTDDEYEVVLHVIGDSMDHYYENKMDIYCYITDQAPFNLQMINNAFEDKQVKSKRILVVRNYVSSEYLDLSLCRFKMRVGQTYLIPYSQKDYETGLRSQCSDLFQYASLSTPLKNALLDIVTSTSALCPSHDIIARLCRDVELSM